MKYAVAKSLLHTYTQNECISPNNITQYIYIHTYIFKIQIFIQHTKHIHTLTHKTYIYIRTYIYLYNCLFK